MTTNGANTMKKNLKQLAKDIIETDKERKSTPDHNLYNKEFYTLVAYGGDLSAGALGYSATQIQVHKQDYNLVANYLNFSDDYNFYTTGTGNATRRNRWNIMIYKNIYNALSISFKSRRALAQL